VSGYRGANSKTGALGAFLREVDNGSVPRGSFLLVENLDRLTRADIVTASTLFNQIILAGINLVTLTSGEVWSTERLAENPYGMIEITVELIRGNRESARKAQLVGDAKAEKKQRLIAGLDRSKPYTRQTPAWLAWNDTTTQYAPLPDRAAIVLEIFTRADAGDGIDRIAKDLNQRGVETWGGRKGQRKADHWRGSYMRKILKSAAPIGSFVPHTTGCDPETGARRDEPMETVVGLFPAVVSAEHHRIAAYLKLKCAETIKCEWFAGSVREAADEGLRRNEIVHLRVDQGDKAEEAWKRTLLGWGSKAEVVGITGCGEGTVAKMRRAAVWYRRHASGAEKTAMGEKLCGAFPGDLEKHKWTEVNRVLLDLTPTEWNAHDAAVKLSRNLTLRMTNTLSENPEVTAEALWLYDRTMCPELVEALKGRIRSAEEAEKLEAQAAHEETGEG
jgi:hypothetical protein